ncbi:MAG: glyoxalase [Caulobacteraceae bacterium]|nr:MAG: glyoxalase [Caulobacteraceae bacterium]
MTLTALDHMAMVVHDLDTAVDGYTRLLGRAPDWLGLSGPVRHAWFQLGNTALDIIAPAGQGPSGAWLAEHGEGLWGLAFASDDIEAERKRLARLSMPSTDVMPIRTKSADGEARIWPTSVLDSDATAGVTAFLIGETPDWPVAPASGDEAAAVSGLDHVVVSTRNPTRAAALYGARLGLGFKLDRSNPDWGTRLMFFKVGDLVVEVAHQLKNELSDDPDSLWGLTWRVPDVAAAHARMTAAGLSLSEVREGRKPGSRVFTVKDAPAGVPTLIIGPA